MSIASKVLLVGAAVAEYGQFHLQLQELGADEWKRMVPEKTQAISTAVRELCFEVADEAGKGERDAARLRVKLMLLLPGEVTESGGK